jgi:lysine-N-methylase
VIDDRTLNKYKSCRTPFGSRLANSIDWEEQSFQQYEGRCAFLNEQNLCDIYIEAGEHMLCRTCRMYPRHIEEFENEREISLSLSCPVVARMLLKREQPVRFLSAEDEKEEAEDEEFDFFLYSALQDCRSAMIDSLQDRTYPVAIRMAKILALAHDVQNRINSRRIFEIEEVLERYQRPGADAALQRKLLRWMEERTEWITGKNSGSDVDTQEHPGSVAIWAMQKKKELLALLDELEVLDASWQEQLKVYREFLYEKGEILYTKRRKLIARLWARQDSEVEAKKVAANVHPEYERTGWTEIESEQLMVYFIFTYFCGAIYDGDAFAKVKMAVVSTLILRELELAAQIGMGPMTLITLEDRARIAWRYSRELEHSDENLNRMEELMNETKVCSFETLLLLLLNEDKLAKEDVEDE